MRFRVRNAADKAAVKEYIDRCRDGVEYAVEIAMKRHRRTVDQNRLYWLYVSCISDETGNDRETVHNELRRLFLPVHTATLGGRTVEKLTSTTTLDTAQFTRYIDHITAFAGAELGIVLPDPADAYWEQFYEYYKSYI